MSEIFEDFGVWFYKAPAKRIMAAILIIAFGMFLNSICIEFLIAYVIFMIMFIGSFALFYLLDIL